ncbi:hypothetical protein ACH4F6_07715 [Streptomyces sp. NPDC017936]|uniref:hypothetical protein n=1 Tax=Streptomyces sp. NPDC017936 TaxID=3365016 RepID=UPI0037912101
MRGLPVRRIASTALCASLVLGAVAPTALAEETDRARERSAAESRAPVPGADALLAQVKTLGDLGAALAPITDLLDSSLKTGSGRLSADQAEQLGDAVREAVAELSAATAVTPPATTATTTGPDTAPTPVTGTTSTTGTTASDATATATGDTAAATGDTAPETGTDAATMNAAVGNAAAAADLATTAAAGHLAAVTGMFPFDWLPSLTRSGGAAKAAAPAADLRADAVAALQKALDALLEAVTSGDADEVLPAATSVVTGVVDLLTATLLGGGLPAPSLAGLPQPPALPAAPTAPVAPPQPPTGAAAPTS